MILDVESNPYFRKFKMRRAAWVLCLPLLWAGCQAAGNPADGRYRDLPQEVQADLLEIKSLLLADLSRPGSCLRANGLPDKGRLSYHLTLACGWTDPDFIQPLLALLANSPDHRFIAAACLLRYGREDLDVAVARLSHFKPRGWGGCMPIADMSIGELLAEFRRTLKLPDWLQPADFDHHLRRLKQGSLEERGAAWIHFARLGWFAPGGDFGLDLKTLYRTSKGLNHLGCGLGLEIGTGRALRLLGELLKTNPAEPEKSLWTARRWYMGGIEEAAACRAMLEDLIKRLGEEPDPSFKSFIPLLFICERPAAEDLDLYLKLLACKSWSLRSLGWEALSRLDPEKSLQLLKDRWREPNQETLKEASGHMRLVSGIAEWTTPNRGRWIDWLISVRPKIPFTASPYALWIDATAAMAGKEFGFSGAMIPGGFDQAAAQSTTKAILDWNAAGRPR